MTDYLIKRLLDSTARRKLLDLLKEYNCEIKTGFLREMSYIGEQENWVERMLCVINSSFSQENLIEILRRPELPTIMEEKIYLILLTEEKELFLESIYEFNPDLDLKSTILRIDTLVATEAFSNDFKDYDNKVKQDHAIGTASFLCQSYNKENFIIPEAYLGVFDDRNDEN